MKFFFFILGGRIEWISSPFLLVFFLSLYYIIWCLFVHNIYVLYCFQCVNSKHTNIYFSSFGAVFPLININLNINFSFIPEKNKHFYRFWYWCHIRYSAVFIYVYVCYYFWYNSMKFMLRISSIYLIDSLFWMWPWSVFFFLTDKTYDRDLILNVRSFI